MDELPPIRNEIRVSSAKRFFVIDPRTGLRVTGVPDALFELEDRTYAIIDYKVSNVNESARSDNPIYRAQLSIYAFIAETLGYRPVSHLGLLYYEPLLVNGEVGMPKKYLKRHSFMLPFQAHYFPIAPDSNIHSYFERAYCEDCRKLRELIAAVTG